MDAHCSKFQFCLSPHKFIQNGNFQPQVLYFCHKVLRQAKIYGDVLLWQLSRPASSLPGLNRRHHSSRNVELSKAVPPSRERT